MDAIYQRDREENKEFDQDVQETQGLEGREKIDALSEAAKKRELGNRMLQSMGLEIGVGVVADILLPSPDPVSRGLNFGIGYAANTLGQLWEGQGFSHGEAVAAGTFQAIPFGTVARGAKGLYRAAAKGALQGAVSRQVEVGIDEQRLITPQEALTSAGTGAVFGGAVKGTQEVARKALPVIRQAGKGAGLTKAVLSRADDATSTAVRAGVPSTLDALNMLDKRRELGMTMMARLDGPNEEIFGPLARATRSAAPKPAWGPDVTDVPINPKSLAREVYDQSQEFMEASLSTVDRYKGGGYSKGLSEWTRQVFEPLMKLAEEKTGQNMYSLLATHPGFKYIEHRIAKTPKLEWFWRRFGDNIAGTNNADDISNLRILLNDRYKALKDAVEAQFYGKSRGRGGDPVKGINDSIKKHSERYIVDVENPQLGGRHLSMEHNPGNLVIRKAGTGEVVGMIGEYYEVLYSNTKQLAEQLTIKFPEWRDLTPSQLETKVREWRKRIITDHLNIIRKKEAALQGLNNDQRILRINEALLEDMIEFREKYKGILPELTEGVWRKLSKDGISEFMKETPQRVYTGGLRIDRRRTNPYYPERIDLGQ